MQSGVQIISISVSGFPSLSLSIGSSSEMSCALFFIERKCISISFSTHFAAYVARRVPLSGLNESIAFISPTVPIEIRSS